MTASALAVLCAGKTFHVRGKPLRALDRVNLDVREDEYVAILGRSGAGKTTLARCMACMETLTDGEILWQGAPVPAFFSGVQLLFQDSPTALNPRWRVRDLIAEPLLIRGTGTAASHSAELMNQVGLDPSLANRKPAELSGGQRQRVALARALAVAETKVLILDEPFRGLDPESRDALASLLSRIRRERSLAIVHITHDLAHVLRAADRVIVMDRGTVVEEGSAAGFAHNAHHAASKALINALFPGDEV